MATKSYSKHKEYQEFSSKGTGAVSYPDEQFDMLKSELIPKGSKLESLGRTPNGGAREYHYEYKEEKHPTGKYDRKDLRTVEEYEVPPKTSTPKKSESSSYYYEKQERELPSYGRTYNYDTKYDGKYENSYDAKYESKFDTKYDSKYDSKYESSAASSPAYSKVKTSQATKEIHQNVDELDSLLDDLQKDQERQQLRSGYASDTAESSSFDYRKGTPAKAPSSGYSTLKREERLESSSWNSSPPPPVTRAQEYRQERQEVYREEKHTVPVAVPAPAVKREERYESWNHSSLPIAAPVRSQELRQEVYREEKHEQRVVPSQLSPALPQPVPPTLCSHCHHSTASVAATASATNTLTRSAVPTPMNKVTTTVKTYTYEVPADQDPTAAPLPALADHQRTYVSQQENIRTNSLAVPPSPAGCQYCSHCNTRIQEYRHVASDEHTNERMVYPNTITETRLRPVNETNGNGPTTYKYFETTYSKHDTTERIPLDTPAFPRPVTPQPVTQETPKRLDDLLADFPEARFPTQPDGVTHRKVEVMHERSARSLDQSNVAKPVPPPTRNIAGPPVYYPPNHGPTPKKEVAGYNASASQSGGAYASGKGMYEYESGSKSKEKHSEKKTAVPVCLPMCCAMPCVIM